MKKKLIARSFIHSCYVPVNEKGNDAVSVVEHLHYSDGSVEPNLRFISNPQKSFYLTKKPLRATHTEKKERESLDNLDKHIVPNKKFFECAYKILNERPAFQGKGLRDKVLESPYIYGGDMDIESLIKIKYKKDFEKSGLNLAPISVGMLDIEVSINPGSEGVLLCYTLTHENKVYTAINKNWMYSYKKGKHVPFDEKSIIDLSQRTLTPLIENAFRDNKNLEASKEKLPFEFHYFVSESEVEMIKWGFEKLHENKTLFIGGWNIKFDVESLAKILKKHGVDPRSVFCPPETPEEIKYFRIKEDHKPVEHFTQKWHWFSTTSYFQFLDLMAVYARLRTVEGKEYSYKLDYILKKNGLGGKIHWEDLKEVNKLEGTADWHKKMSTQYFKQYVIYNQWDSISLQLLEWLNKDIDALRILSDNTPIEKYPRQTIRIRDSLYAEWIDNGYVIGTSSSDMRSEEDKRIEAMGGSVLSATKVEDCGVRLLKEAPHMRTQVHVFVSDADFSQMYPTIMESGNIAKETKVSTVYDVIGDHIKVDKSKRIERLHSYLISTKENAHYLGTEFLNLPTFNQIREKYEEYKNKKE